MREIPNLSDFKPSEFMRARRPELFSDSVAFQDPQLSPQVFENHLETLTNRKQENDFEHFCRKLAEKELCPNLIPQTGPTGGGDSKVDTETYPVADAISLRWYEGIGREAAQERWAFAFSAKKKWRPKVDSDVAGIVATQRGYKLIYFITNQYVRDKNRAEVEDTLKKKYGVDVRILDRSWIVKAVFEHNRISLAIDALRISGFEVLQGKQKGPRDTESQIELDELEKQINDPDRYTGVEYQLVEDCLDAALLARQLEVPRIEVDGRFQRAERVAEKVGNKQQMLRVVYKRAWSAFWWYDDFEELNRLYDQVEKYAIGASEAYDLELLANLWTVMGTSIDRGRLDPIQTKFDQQTKTLKSELARLAGDTRRPNNALQARTTAVLMNLNPLAAGGPDRIDRVFDELREILPASEGLGSYPIEPLFRIIQELGEYITNSASYDSLFECLIDLIESRTSSAQTGKTLLQRGIQKLEAGKNYDAIRLLGRAQQKLGMEECREEGIIALAACGSAYESVGLIWAARASLLAASSLAFSEFTKQGLLVPQTLVCTKRLVWLELQLGRIPYVLAWIELMTWVAFHLNLEGERLERLRVERMKQDMTLGLLLLKTDFWDLKWLDFLPSVLEKLHLDASWMALLYALGYEDRLRSEKMVPADRDQKATSEFFLQWLKQPAADDLPEKPEFLQGRTVSLISVVLGCKIVVEAANYPDSIYLSETILGVLEAFLATSMGEKVFAHRSEFRLVVKLSDYAGDLPEYRFDQKGMNGGVEITHGENLAYHTREERAAFRTWLINLIAQIMSRVFHISDSNDYLTRLARDEAGFDRALNYSDVSICIENILGQSPKMRLSDWEAESTEERFPLHRQSVWSYGLQQPADTGSGAIVCC